MADAEDWDDLRSEWTTAAPGEGRFDVDALKTRIRRANRRILLTTIAEVLAVSTVVVFIASRVISAGTVQWRDLFAMLFLAFGVASVVWARRGPWTNEWDNIDQLASIAEHRARSGLRYARAGYMLAVVACILVALIFVRDVVRGDPWLNLWLLIGTYVYIGLVSLICGRMASNRKRELGEAKALRARLRETDEGVTPLLP